MVEASKRPVDDNSDKDTSEMPASDNDLYISILEYDDDILGLVDEEEVIELD